MPTPWIVDQCDDGSRARAARAAWRAEAPRPIPAGIADVDVDFETTGLDVHGADVAVGLTVSHDAWSQYLPFAHRGGGNLDEGAVREFARRELAGKDLHASNMKFDAETSRKWGVDLEAIGCRLHDVQHWAALLDDHRRRFGIDALAADYLPAGERKIDLPIERDKAKLWQRPGWEAGPYGEQDGRLVGALRRAMKPLLAEQGLRRVAELEGRLIPVTMEMERNGMPIDVPLLERWVRESRQAFERTLWSLWRLTGVKVEQDSPESLSRLFHALGLKIASTPTGRPSFEDAILKSLEDADPEAARGFEHAALWLLSMPEADQARAREAIRLVRRARKYASLRSKFLLPYWEAAGATGLLRYSLHQCRADEHGTVSGRYSASNKNIQQVMTPDRQREAFGDDEFIVRRLFVETGGRTLASADAEQVEYRFLGHYAEAPDVLAAYAADPHADFHAVVQGMVAPRAPIIRKLLEAGNAKRARKLTKNVSFAKSFGAGPSKIAEMLGMTDDDAAAFVSAYDRAFPEIGALQRRVERVVKARGYVKDILGRRARFEDRQRLHAALNRIIQGSAAEENKLKLCEAYGERARLGFTMRATVHDEMIGGLADPGMARALGEVLDRQLLPTKIPLLWDVAIGANWADAKSIGKGKA